jgi:hypothetical protein
MSTKRLKRHNRDREPLKARVRSLIPFDSETMVRYDGEKSDAWTWAARKRLVLAAFLVSGLALSGACGADSAPAKRRSTMPAPAGSNFVIVDIPPPIFAPGDDDDDDRDPAFQAAMDRAWEYLSASRGPARLSATPMPSVSSDLDDWGPYELAELAAMEAITDAVSEWCTTLGDSVLRLPALNGASAVDAPFPWPVAMRDGHSGVPISGAADAYVAITSWLNAAVMGGEMLGLNMGTVRISTRLSIELWDFMSDYALSSARTSTNTAAASCLTAAAAGFEVMRFAGQAMLDRGREFVPDETDLRSALEFVLRLTM